MPSFLPRSLSARITFGVVLTVLLIGGASFWVIQHFYRQQMIHSLAEGTTVHGELIEESLRHAMHTRSLDLLAEMVRNLASQRGVENVMILNKKGTIRFSSDPRERGRVLTESDPTCSICHRQNPSIRGRTVVFETTGGEKVFRNVNPILNSQSCHGCHPATDRLNGILIVDYSLAGIEESLHAGANKMWLSALALALAITAVIIVLTRRLILRRLGTLTRAVDAIEMGELDNRVDETGHDEISLLSRHVNLMADSLNRSLRSLREREAFLDAVINSADDGIVVVDDQMKVVTANRTYATLLESEPDRLRRLSCCDSLLCGERHPSECPARMTFETGDVIRRIRTVADPRGNVRHYEIAASPLRHADDRPQVLEIWRDITRRRELEAQLAHSEKLASLGYLASGISHEINNPLASIATCIDGLRRRLRDGSGNGVPGELPEYLDLIRGEVGRCRDLTDRLKVLGRQPRATPEPVQLGTVIRDTLALVRYEARRCSVRIEEDVAADLPTILADEGQVRQVMLNVILNAIQAVGNDGIVRVGAHRGHGGVEVAVSDTGCGIQPAALGQIFEPFYSARPDGRGTGLGLFISKIIIDQMGGTIQVTSTPGSMTRFTIGFPLAAGVEHGRAS